MDQTQVQSDKEHYYRQFEISEKWLSDAGASLNNLLLIVGTGSFTLSLAFLSGSLSSIDVVHIGLLIASWGFFAFSIILLGWKFLVVQFFADRAQVLTNTWSTNGFEGENTVLTDLKLKNWSLLKKCMTILSLISMTFGTLSLLSFGVLNVLNTVGDICLLY